jgi:hypothetical protein
VLGVEPSELTGHAAATGETGEKDPRSGKKTRSPVFSAEEIAAGKMRLVINKVVTTDQFFRIAEILREGDE